MTIRAHTTRWVIALFLAVPAASERAMAQPVDQRRGPLPPGSTIDARDGDTVLIDDDARVRVIRRRHARVRAVYDPTQRWLILLARYQPRNGITTDSTDAFIFDDVEGDWTLETRWEGDSTVDVYALAGQAGYAGVGFQTPSGTVQLFSRERQQMFKEPAAVVLVYRGSSSRTARGSFDEVERLTVDEASGKRTPPVTVDVTGGVADAPVRLPSQSSSIAAPRKIYDLRPVWPDEARRASVQGIVIVEFTVGADGIVADARILRGIPLLDKAALDCVRQWRYEPTLLNGRPVPFRMMAAVTFP